MLAKRDEDSELRASYAASFSKRLVTWFYESRFEPSRKPLIFLHHDSMMQSLEYPLSCVALLGTVLHYTRCPIALSLRPEGQLAHIS